MKLSFEQRLARLTPDFQAKYMEEQKTEWDALVFNVDIPPIYRLFALSFEHPTTLQVKAEYFNFLAFGEIPEMNMSDAITICRAFTRTLQDWIKCFGMNKDTHKEYADYLVFTEQLIEKVNETIEPISEKVFRKVETLQKLQLQNGNRKIALA